MRAREVLGAVSAVNTEIRGLLRARPWTSLAEADQAMTDLDGTANKSRLGANVTVGVSMALARALAASAGKALWRWLAPDGVPPSLLMPQFNMRNGGVYAPNPLAVFSESAVGAVEALPRSSANKEGVSR